MKTVIRIIIISLILFIVLFGITNCSPPISQEEYDKIKNELSDVKQQVAALQDELKEAKMFEVQYDQLDIQYQELKKQYDAQIGELQTIRSKFDELNDSYEQLMRQGDAGADAVQALQAEYDDLDQKYEELKIQYDIIVQSQTFSEEDVDQAIFALINQERIRNGSSVIEWGVNLYGWAMQNNRAMEAAGEYKYSSWISWQAVLMTAGQATLDELAEGTLLIWKQNKYKFDRFFLNPSIPYGAVATYKSGGIYYITYMAAIDP